MILVDIPFPPTLFCPSPSVYSYAFSLSESKKKAFLQGLTVITTPKKADQSSGSGWQAAENQALRSW